MKTSKNQLPISRKSPREHPSHRPCRQDPPTHTLRYWGDSKERQDIGHASKYVREHPGSDTCVNPSMLARQGWSFTSLQSLPSLWVDSGTCFQQTLQIKEDTATSPPDKPIRPHPSQVIKAGVTGDTESTWGIPFPPNHHPSVIMRRHQMNSTAPPSPNTCQCYSKASRS